jgi:hypothetical protein
MCRDLSVSIVAVIIGIGILTLVILVALPDQAFAQAIGGKSGVGGLGGLPGKVAVAGPGGSASNNHGANGSNNHGHSHNG